jgi:hypothetical protein
MENNIVVLKPATVEAYARSCQEALGQIREQIGRLERYDETIMRRYSAALLPMLRNVSADGMTIVSELVADDDMDTLSDYYAQLVEWIVMVGQLEALGNEHVIASFGVFIGGPGGEA